MLSNVQSFAVATGVAVSTLSLTLSAPADAASFTGAYAPANLTLVNRNANGFVNTSNAPESITLTGGNNESGTNGTTDYIGQAASSGLLKFNWSYLTQDAAAFFDPFSFVINGNSTNIFGGLSTQGQGSFSTNVNTGDFFSFRIATADNEFDPASVTISDFSIGNATAIPTPALLPGLLALSAGVLRKRKSEQAVVPINQGNYQK